MRPIPHRHLERELGGQKGYGWPKATPLVSSRTRTQAQIFDLQAGTFGPMKLLPKGESLKPGIFSCAAIGEGGGGPAAAESGRTKVRRVLVCREDLQGRSVPRKDGRLAGGQESCPSNPGLASMHM